MIVVDSMFLALMGYLSERIETVIELMEYCRYRPPCDAGTPRACSIMNCTSCACCGGTLRATASPKMSSIAKSVQLISKPVHKPRVDTMRPMTLTRSRLGSAPPGPAKLTHMRSNVAMAIGISRCMAATTLPARSNATSPPKYCSRKRSSACGCEPSVSTSTMFLLRYGARASMCASAMSRPTPLVLSGSRWKCSRCGGRR
mmetsp:Transcript_8446/g.20016  ORF Transcript_8446/g.20016 Transcript_8446/m.20016 type:complete len:201 (-) Transcript_8446:633-1235(-)